MLKTWRIYFVSVCLAVSGLVSAEEAQVKIPEITNWPEIEKSLKLSVFKNKKMNKKIKIAVLDNGFSGLESVKKHLPADVVYDNGPSSDADRRKKVPPHGSFMALMAAQVIARSGIEANYEMKLFNAFGITKFTHAVETVIKEQFDVVLYSQVWEFGGNGDGKGFINTLVNKATSAGIVWINAAGNFSPLTRLGPVDGKAEGGGEYVVFKDKRGRPSKGAKIICRAPPGQKCTTRIVVAWNDFKDETGIGTEKDLDLILIDAKGKDVARVEKRQKASNDGSEDLSLYPRELIDQVCRSKDDCDPFEIPPGEYWVRAKIISKNFSASQDKVRITVSGDGIQMIDPDTDETLLPPADNATVVLIGARDELASRSKALKLPEIFLPSVVKLKDGSVPFSTSIAAAFAAGLTVMNLGTDTEKTKDAVSEKLKSIAGKAKSAPVEAEPSSPATQPEAKAKPQPKISIPMGPENNPAPRTAAPSAGPRVAPPQMQSQQQPRPPAGGAPVYPQPVAQSVPPPANCLPARSVPYIYPAVDNMLRNGSISVFFRGWTFILVDTRAYPQVLRLEPGMRLFIGPQGLVPVSHGEVLAGQIPPNFYEVLPGYLYRICQ